MKRYFSSCKYAKFFKDHLIFLLKGHSLRDYRGFDSLVCLSRTLSSSSSRKCFFELTNLAGDNLALNKVEGFGLGLKLYYSYCV